MLFLNHKSPKSCSSPQFCLVLHQRVRLTLQFDPDRQPPSHVHAMHPSLTYLHKARNGKETVLAPCHLVMLSTAAA